MKKIWNLFLFVFYFLISITFAQYNSLPRTHSHNDYERRKPLSEALENDFMSIEADVHLVNGELFIAHTMEEIDTLKTLKNIYLDPIFKIYKDRGNKIYNNSSLILMIDIKTEANKTYHTLKKQLNEYRSMLTIYRSDSLKKGAVDVIISGNRPIEHMRNEKIRLAALDGRPKDIYEDGNPSLFPIISESWSKILQRHPLNANCLQEKTLNKFINEIHTQNKLVRFWGTDDNKEFWKLLLKLDVDLISTDSPTKLNSFLKKIKK